MLTCFQASTNVIFQRILRFFVKENSIVLDITYGRGLSWDDLKESYVVLKVDKRKTFEDVIQADFNDYLKNKDGSSVDCIYYDSPYYFKEKIRQFNIKGQMLSETEEVFWTEAEFERALQTIQKEVPRVLKGSGVFIVKIMDGYIGKEYYPLAFKIFDAMSKVMKAKGTFICPIQKKDNVVQLIRENHIYYLIFENKN